MKAKIQDGQVVQYPYSIADLQRDNPNTIFGLQEIPWGDYGVVDVAPTPRPDGKSFEQTPVLDGENWVQVWEVEPYTDQELLDLITAKRYEKETGGFIFAGSPILSDDRSQSKIIGAALAAIQDPMYTSRWKSQSGFVELNATQLIAMATALRDHVQACFDRESDLMDAVADESFEIAMLEDGWP